MGESLWDYELLFNSDFPVRHLTAVALHATCPLHGVAACCMLHPLPCVRAALSPLEVTPTSDAQNQQDKARPLIVSDGATIVPRIGTIHTAKPRAIAARPDLHSLRCGQRIALRHSTAVGLVDSLEESLGSVDRFSDSATAACGAGRGPARTLEGVHALLHVVRRGGAFT